MELTNHSVKRMRKRLGINKQGTQRELERIKDGMKIKDCAGRLRRYLDHQRQLHGMHAHFRITPNAVYAFQGEALTTAWIMPKKTRKISPLAMEAIQRKQIRPL
jgi:hypothetical protein